MSNLRKTIFANDQIYHIYNRSIERKSIFTTKWEYQRSLDTLNYYHFSNLPFRFSYLQKLNKDIREKILFEINEGKDKLLEIIAFCLMPNHFHFMVKQIQNNGIIKFVSKFSNSYTKYFNTKHKRKGPLFEGIFQANLVETEEQLVHLSRYIHLNPTSSYIIPQKDLLDYEWSSLPEYLNLKNKTICNKELVLNLFSSVADYKKFVLDQISYAQELDKIKHLTLEQEGVNVFHLEGVKSKLVF